MQSNQTSAPSDRLTIHDLDSCDSSGGFARDVRAGLTASPKTLPPKYFYDGLGSRLFEAICSLPEYYLTRAESEILSARAGEIIALSAASSKQSIRLIELGSGSALKTRYLIDAVLHRQPELHYLPVDISAASLERSSEELLHEYPRLRITAYAADYLTALRGPAGSRITQCEQSERNVVLFLGSNIGNFDPNESREFLREIREVLRTGDALLMGADLKKPASVLIPAYDDVLGVTAAFNRNLLLRINRELSGDFDVAQFAHRALYDDQLGRVEMHLVSLLSQTVRIRAIELKSGFARGETIHTESSYKFDTDQLSELARDSGFILGKTWFDSARRFSFNLFAAE